MRSGFEGEGARSDSVASKIELSLFVTGARHTSLAA